MGFWWNVVLALLGVLVPIFALLYEFVLKGRKRLGYRVQMDTTAADKAPSPYAGALQQLKRDDGLLLRDPSFVLLRIENNGATNIDTNDYAVRDDDKVGVRVTFPGRRVAGMVVTELSDEFLRPAFGVDSALCVRDGTIELPRVPLNRSAHYKVLAALERDPDAPGRAGEPFRDPEVVGGIKGGIGRGRIQETKSRTGPSRTAIGLVAFLVLVVLGQLAVSLNAGGGAPLECATGELTIVGSTAFTPVLTEAADLYRKSCPGASFRLDTRGSVEGLRRLNEAGRHSAESSQIVAFSDGEKPDGYPQLLPSPIAFLLFTLVINKAAGVEDLTMPQIRQLYSGKINNWKQIGGNDLPVRLVSRNPDSGTRAAFQKRILAGATEFGSNSGDCLRLAPGVRCERASTSELLDAVTETPGAIGYSEVGAAVQRKDLRLVRIGGRRATLSEADGGAYPFWETELAYSYGDPAVGSLAASFLRYLRDDVGRDIVRSSGDRPCAELQNPVLCRPA